MKFLKFLHRKFTLWRLRPARQSINDAHGQGRINSKQLHDLDAAMLRRVGFSYLVALVCLFAALITPAQAQLTVTPGAGTIAYAKVYPLTNSTTFTIATGGTNLATASLTVINSQAFPITPGRGFATHLEIIGTNAGTAAVTPFFQFATPKKTGSTYTTNWSQYVPGAAATQNGTTRVFSFGVTPPTTVDNVQLGRLAVVSNAHSASITLSSTNTYVTISP
jgi:hypothetical protein